MGSGVGLRADSPGLAAILATQTLPCGALENMPRWLICIPLVLQWCSLALRYRSLTLPSSANPAITSGGLVGRRQAGVFPGHGPARSVVHRTPLRHFHAAVDITAGAAALDVRFHSLPELRAGVGFKIMEINGAGSEAIEAWDPGISVVAGFAIIFAKQRTLFAIGARQRRAGVQPIGVLALARLQLRQQGLIAIYPPSN